MSSPNILLTRIDNRLVHGQVGVTWTSTIGANLLVVVDDVVANDDIQQKLMGITAETYGFEVAGGILPAVGFGLLLRVMFKAQYIPYLIAGFLFVCYIQVSNLLPVAVLGAGFAVYEFFNAKSRQQAQPQPVASKNEEEDYSNGI